MGWSYNTTKQTKTEFLKEIKDQIGDKLLASKAIGKEFWCLVKRDDYVTIVLYLTQRDGHCWGYKNMDESMGPSYYTCPETFLNRSTIVNRNWREQCRRFQELQKQVANLKIGDKVFISNTWVGTYKQTRAQNIILDYNGMLYRVHKNSVVKVETV